MAANFMRINECVLMDFPQIVDARGCLSVVECHKHIPFKVQRLFYTYAFPPGAERGGHAHCHSQEVIIPIAGSFDITLHDGFVEKQFTLKQPHQGLYLAPLVWVELNCFSTDAICLVLASEVYNETSYIRDYQTFLQIARGDNADTFS